MKSSKLDRRTFLRGAGGVAIGLPLLNAMGCLAPRGSDRSAQGLTGAPKRFVVMFSPNGTIAPAWTPTGTETSFQLGPILAPLAPHQKDLLVFWGVDVTSATHGPGDDHNRGMAHQLTGTENLSGTMSSCGNPPTGFNGGISVDQAIANVVGVGTKFKSLELGVMVQDSSVWGRMIYNGPNQPVPPEESPYNAFTRVFSGLGADPFGAMKLMAQRRSVLDAVTADYQSLNAKLGGQDRIKLDAHLTAVRDIENHLATTGTIGGACMKPNQGASMLDLQDPKNFPTVGQLQMDLLVYAMACDLTRVGSIQWTRSTSDMVFSWLNMGITEGHHTLSHKPDSDTTSQNQLIGINTWYAQQLAYLITKMKSIPEGSGTMFDNTVILWSNELGKGNAHSHTDVPFVLAGSCGGYFRTGRYLAYNPSQPHNNLLVSLQNAMGLPVTTFGNPAYCTGPFKNLT